MAGLFGGMSGIGWKAFRSPARIGRRHSGVHREDFEGLEGAGVGKRSSPVGWSMVSGKKGCVPELIEQLLNRLFVPVSSRGLSFVSAELTCRGPGWITRRVGLAGWSRWSVKCPRPKPQCPAGMNWLPIPTRGGGRFRTAKFFCISGKENKGRVMDSQYKKFLKI